MPTAEVTINTTGPDEVEDLMTKRLVRLLLVAEIVTQVAYTVVVLDMLDHGDIAKKIDWHLERWKKRWTDRRTAEKRVRLEVGKVIFEAQEIVRSAANG